jgi:hypothetical protein
MKLLPHLVHILEHENARPLHTLILELIYTTLTVKVEAKEDNYKPEVPMRNYLMVMRANGLDNLFNLLSRTFVAKVKEGRSGQAERIRRGRVIVDILQTMLEARNVM